jgi:hypothetical protein
MEGTPQFGGQNYSSTHASQAWGIKEVPTPKQLVSQLDQWVIGQTPAKKTLAVAVYNHFKRLQNKRAHLQRTQAAAAPHPGATPNLLVRARSCWARGSARPWLVPALAPSLKHLNTPRLPLQTPAPRSRRSAA